MKIHDSATLPSCASPYPQKCGLKSSEPKSGLLIEKFSNKKKQISDSFPLSNWVIKWGTPQFKAPFKFM
jgi:hypothetical protein